MNVLHVTQEEDYYKTTFLHLYTFVSLCARLFVSGGSRQAALFIYLIITFTVTASQPALTTAPAVISVFANPVL